MRGRFEGRRDPAAEAISLAHSLGFEQRATNGRFVVEYRVMDQRGVLQEPPAWVRTGVAFIHEANAKKFVAGDPELRYVDLGKPPVWRYYDATFKSRPAWDADEKPSPVKPAKRRRPKLENSDEELRELERLARTGGGADIVRYLVALGRVGGLPEGFDPEDWESEVSNAIDGAITELADESAAQAWSIEEGLNAHTVAWFGDAQALNGDLIGVMDAPVVIHPDGWVETRLGGDVSVTEEEVQTEYAVHRASKNLKLPEWLIVASGRVPADEQVYASVSGQTEVWMSPEAVRDYARSHGMHVWQVADLPDPLDEQQATGDPDLAVAPRASDLAGLDRSRIIRYVDLFEYHLVTWYAQGDQIGFRFIDPSGEVIFEGEDFRPGASTDFAGNEAVRELMGFLTLRPGDTDREYFASYTPRQLEYAAHEAELYDPDGWIIDLPFGQDERDEERATERDFERRADEHFGGFGE